VHFSWLGFIEMFVVLAFALGWGVLELVALRLDKQREKAVKLAKGPGAPPGRRE
jgi:hypothetical protein